MHYECPLLVVEDMSRSRTFYETVLHQTVALDFGANITFSSGFALQTKAMFADFLEKPQKEILRKTNNFELYFEEDAFDAFCAQLKARGDITLVHDVKEFPWGQKSIRFYDPDGHIIEVGQTMAAVAQAFAGQGMTPEEIAKRMDSPIEYVKSLIK